MALIMHKLARARHPGFDGPVPERAGHLTAAQTVLAVAFLAGLVIRLLILNTTSTLQPEIVDEQHYTLLAENLSAGNGFAWSAGDPTSMRPPAYPAFVAAIWSFTGVGNYQAVRVVQLVLALLASWLVYLIGVRTFDKTVGAYAAAALWLYPTLIFFNFTLLTETLFTLLLIAFVLSTIVVVEKPTVWAGVWCGLVLGLAALTRSVLWPVPAVLCPLLAVMLRREPRVRVLVPIAVLVGYAVTVGPWAVRNTRLQHTFTAVDVIGGYNLRMGNYQYTPDDRMWDAVALTGEKNWSYELSVERPGQTFTDGEKTQWAQRKAFEYMLAHPLETARRDLIKFADFWGLEREFIAGVQRHMYAPPKWMAVIGGVAIAVSYVALIVTAAAGVWLAAPRARTHILLLLPIVLITAAHTVTFGHSRYHLPLVPILALYGASFFSRGRDMHQPHYLLKALGAAATIAIFVIVWLRQLLSGADAAHLGRFLNG
jgi:4-amino-4-deoxy-L-arabinose transferase-like glycosyltransferase